MVVKSQVFLVHVPIFSRVWLTKTSVLWNPTFGSAREPVVLVLFVSFIYVKPSFCIYVYKLYNINIYIYVSYSHEIWTVRLINWIITYTRRLKHLYHLYLEYRHVQVFHVSLPQKIYVEYLTISSAIFSMISHPRFGV